jgi:hypothetical protein
MSLCLSLFLALAPPALVGDVDPSVEGLAPPDSHAVTTSQELWSWSTGAGAPGLALVDHGGMGVAFPSTYLVGIQLLSTFDTPPFVAPVWQSDDVYEAYGIVGADATDTFLGMRAELAGPTSTLGTLFRFTSASTEPVWAYSYEPQFFSYPLYDISRDGQVIASVFDSEASDTHDFRIHDLETGAVTALWSFPFVGSTNRFDLSPDGKIMGRSRGGGEGMAQLINVATGQVHLETPGTLPREQAISVNGNSVMTHVLEPGVGWHVVVQSRGGGGWQTKLDVFTPLEEYPVELALSDDGSVAVATWKDDSKPYRVWLRAYDVEAGTLLLERKPGDLPASFTNIPEDVDISADGTRFVMGSWGTGLGGPSELVVYDPWADANIASFPQNGAVFDLDFSADGRFLLVDRILNHPSQGHNTHLVKMYEVGGADLRAVGPPSLGETVSLEVLGPPDVPALLLASLGLAPTPIPVGVGGALALDPNTLLILGIGTTDAGGTASLELDVPVDVSVIGLAVYFQGATTAPKLLGDTWMKLTVLP